MHISKITRAGQITIPKKIRTGRVFSHAKAVTFEERGDEVVVKPLRSDHELPLNMDHWPFVEYTMRDWLDPVNDDLFKMPKGL